MKKKQKDLYKAVNTQQEEDDLIQSLYKGPL